MLQAPDAGVQGQLGVQQQQPSSFLSALDPQHAAAQAQQAALQQQVGAAGGELALTGLQNETGEYNCFLNVIIQCLWRCAEFRQQVRGGGGMGGVGGLQWLDACFMPVSALLRAMASITPSDPAHDPTQPTQTQPAAPHPLRCCPGAQPSLPATPWPTRCTACSERWRRPRRSSTARAARAAPPCLSTLESCGRRWRRCLTSCSSWVGPLLVQRSPKLRWGMPACLACSRAVWQQHTMGQPAAVLVRVRAVPPPPAKHRRQRCGGRPAPSSCAWACPLLVRRRDERRGGDAAYDV